MRRSIFIFLICASIAFVVVPLGAAQQPSTEIDRIIESVRADMRADKIAIVTEVMNLSAAESQKFWPVYREYEAEVMKLNDKRILLLKEYAAKYVTLTDSEAKAIIDKSFEWETSRTQLRQAYFDKFTKATSAMTAAKFIQVEHRLDLLLDLQVAAEVPGLFIKPSSSE